VAFIGAQRRPFTEEAGGSADIALHGEPGVSLEGSTLRPDDDASADVYGHPIKAKDTVRGKKTGVPETGRHLVNVLQKSAPRNESERASNQ